MTRCADGPTARYMTHIFDILCRENGTEHRLTKNKHPWTNGQVERMNRTIKEATVKRYHYDNHDQLETHLEDFINACHYARRLKTLKGLTPCKYICKCPTSEPERFKLTPPRRMPGSNTSFLNRIIELGNGQPKRKLVRAGERRVIPTSRKAFRARIRHESRRTPAKNEKAP